MGSSVCEGQGGRLFLRLAGVGVWGAVSSRWGWSGLILVKKQRGGFCGGGEGEK